MAQKREPKAKKPRKQDKTKELPIGAKDLRNPELADDIDAMLEEIDAVLEENAEAFVKGFKQKGGE